jgi:hypothetical protein
MRRRSALFALVLLAAPISARAGETSSAPVSSYVPLQTLTAGIYRPDGRRGVLTVDAGLDAPDPAVRERVVQSEPRLRAAYAATMQIYASGLRPETVPDLERLGGLLQADTDRVLGRRGARFLFGTVMVN